ncbi:hypothetical protein FISHEDRAFT_73554 [Fistulina hepatica ATCC 64428]|uniref:Uncharacterized protein n=1 Tax=Fistulina hepatica ATCC 64428 TaxID=1128425 RepID=A0A0D7AD27_9AGAR|nr:hypothetical protein FISHEDRAFT_73554 [Fistulina hepatica ATCC 64428]
MSPQSASGEDIVFWCSTQPSGALRALASEAQLLQLHEYPGTSGISLPSPSSTPVESAPSKPPITRKNTAESATYGAHNTSDKAQVLIDQLRRMAKSHVCPMDDRLRVLQNAAQASSSRKASRHSMTAPYGRPPRRRRSEPATADCFAVTVPDPVLRSVSEGKGKQRQRFADSVDDSPVRISERAKLQQLGSVDAVMGPPPVPPSRSKLRECVTTGSMSVDEQRPSQHRNPRNTVASVSATSASSSRTQTGNSPAFSATNSRPADHPPSQSHPSPPRGTRRALRPSQAAPENQPQPPQSQPANVSQRPPSSQRRHPPALGMRRDRPGAVSGIKPFKVPLMATRTESSPALISVHPLETEGAKVERTHPAQHSSQPVPAEHRDDDEKAPPADADSSFECDFGVPMEEVFAMMDRMDV